MHEIIKVDPSRCRVWEQNGRMEEYITEESCEDEILSIHDNGQLVPAVGRRLLNDLLHDVEIVCGARRLFAARHLNIPLTVEVREFTDREAVVLMDVENRQRRDWSPYERGRSFAKYLSTGQFQSQDDLARALRISSSQVSRLLKIAKLPAVIIEAFAEPADICETWGLELYSACENAHTRSRIMATARVLNSQGKNLNPREIFDRLRMPGHSQRLGRSKRRHEVVVGPTGQPLFRIRHLDTKVALLIGKKYVSPIKLYRIKEAVSVILQDANAQVPVAISNSTSNSTRSVPETGITY